MRVPQLSLCAIVRDEMINPAGGIVDFVESTVPYCEEAVILDTGSRDGTRETLEELSRKHTNLRIYDHAFDGYGPSRNEAAKYVRTNYILVLDADERVRKEDFERIDFLLKSDIDNECWNMSFINVLPDGSTRDGDGHNPRLLHTSNAGWYGFVWELFSERYKRRVNSNIPIFHFIPDKDAKDAKIREWYRPLERGNLSKAPSETPSFASWKRPNAQREICR